VRATRLVIPVWLIVLAVPLVAGQAGVDSGSIAPGATYSLRFDSVGTFAYYCHPHPGMTGEVIVAEDATTETSASTNVLIKDYAFPQEIRVRPGAVVNWTNGDKEIHTVTFVGEGERVADHMHGDSAMPSLSLLGVLAAAALALLVRRRA
jgi:plastocyanin